MKEKSPVRCTAVESCGMVSRNVFCRHYSKCLDHAILMGWPGFSCESCQCCDPDRLEGDRLNDDHARCLALAFVSGAVDVFRGANPA
ncbi:MAG: hypothetical protein LLG06_09065 [Desulfobacteraceae bacterium]|nr:hypothetical protein [Desulfobacteraceae bacterium]